MGRERGREGEREMRKRKIQKRKMQKRKMQKRKLQKRKMQKRKIQKPKTQRQRRQRHTNNHLKELPKVAKKTTVSAARLACKSIGTYSNQIMDQKLFRKCLVIYMEPLQDFESLFCGVQMQVYAILI